MTRAPLWLALVVAAALAAFSACTAGGGPDPSGSDAATSRSSTPTPPLASDSPGASPATTSSTSPVALARTYHRPCEESVFGTLGGHWREQNPVIGPIAFVGLPGYADVPERTLGIRGDRARPQKVLVVVDRGEPVTLSVAPQARAFVGLVYDPRLFNRRLRLRATDLSVTFIPCGGDQRRTQFNGAMLVLRPGCVALHVRWAGHHRSARFPFAGGAC